MLWQRFVVAEAGSPCCLWMEVLEGPVGVPVVLQEMQPLLGHRPASHDQSQPTAKQVK